jgi:hypothetical protein
MKNLNQTVTMFPVANYPTVWDTIKSDLDQTSYYGLRACVDLMGNGVPDLDKWLPGYGAFWGWVYENAEAQGFYSMEANSSPLYGMPN